MTEISTANPLCALKKSEAVTFLTKVSDMQLLNLNGCFGDYTEYLRLMLVFCIHFEILSVLLTYVKLLLDFVPVLLLCTNYSHICDVVRLRTA